MKSSVRIIGLAVLALAGCGRAEGKNPSADNIRIDTPDLRPETPTLMDQGESEFDRGITQQIRLDIMKDGSLSMLAQNVKIITISGVVTLRGAVKSDAEKQRVGEHAMGVNGVQRVNNYLEILPA